MKHRLRASRVCASWRIAKYLPDQSNQIQSIQYNESPTNLLKHSVIVCTWSIIGCLSLHIRAELSTNIERNCQAYLPCAFPSRRWCNCNAIFCFASLGWSCVLIHCVGRHVFSLLRNDASDSHFTFGCIQNKVFILYMCVFQFIVHKTCCNLFQLFRCFWI